MRLERPIFSLWTVVVLVLSFSATLWLRQVGLTAESTTKFLVPPPEHIEYFHFGFNESLADSLWLRWIQDADNCQTYINEVKILPAAPDRHAEDRFVDIRHKVCDNSWSFRMLDATTRLAPRFEMPYLAGGISLAVITEDYEGASLIFNRGVEAYPEDWRLAYRAAYHFMIDTQEHDKAAQLLESAAKHGAPSWVHALASRLYTEGGQLELALRTLTAYRKTMVGDRGVKEIETRIADLQTRLRASKATLAE